VGFTPLVGEVWTRQNLDATRRAEKTRSLAAI
jgi:hypothetical protein